MEYNRLLFLMHLVLNTFELGLNYSSDELIQNAEDAGARKVKFLFDKSSYDTEKLSHPGLANFQGPALYAYNDARFSDEDWKGVGMLCDSIKVKDPTKVGRFGLGFKSVFHMTDLPSVISGDSLGIIDPHEKYFSDDDGKRSGIRWHLKNNRENMQSNLDQFAPYKGIFDCTQESFKQGSYEGTLFRLPLRQEASKLSETIYSGEKMKGLFECFEKDAHLILLFLTKLEEIEVYERDGQCAEPRKLFHVGISDDCLPNVRKAREEFSAKVQNNISALSDGSFSELKMTYTLTIEKVHYRDGKIPATMSKHSFVVTNFFSGNDVSAKMKSLVGDKSLSYLPWVGVALPLTPHLMNKDDGDDDDDDEPKGHLFCFLPLPLETKSLTGLPVHVNGFFALSQNRRHLKWPSADQNETIQPLTDKSLLWNKGLLNEVLPKAYAELILRISSRRYSYSAWPDLCKVDVKWKEILPPLFKMLLDFEVLHSDANDGVWCRVEEVILDNLKKGDGSRKVVIDLLNKTGKKVVTVPVRVRTALEQYSTVKYITPKLLRNSLKEDPTCYCDLSYAETILLLKFVLSDSDFKDLEGLELLPLSDKTFTTFQARTKWNCSVNIYIDSSEHPKSLLPRLPQLFLDTEVDDCIIKQLKIAVEEGHMQLCYFDEEAVKRHLHDALPLEWKGSEDHVTWYPEKSNQPTLQWLKELWTYFGRHFNHKSDLDAFVGLSLVPVSLSNQIEVQLVRIQRPSSLVLTTFNGESIDDSVCIVLQALGLTVLNVLPEFLQHYPGLVPTVANPASPKGVLNAINVFITKPQNAINLLQRLRKLDADSSRLLRKFMSSISTATQNEEHLLRQLPFFETFVGFGGMKSRFVSINEANAGAPVDDLPAVSVFTDLLDLRDYSSRALAQLLNTVPMTHIDLLKILLDDALNNKYSVAEVDELVKHILERFGMFHGEDLTCIKNKLQGISFVVSSDDSRKKPTELFNPEVDLLGQIFLGEDVFPEGSYYSRPEVNAHLKNLGIKGKEAITLSDIFNSASLVNNIQDINKAATKSRGILKLLEQVPSLLKEQSALNVYLRFIIWIPVLNTRPVTYPTVLPLKNCEDGSFASPNDVTSHEFINLVGSVKLLVKIHSTSKVSKYFGWDQKPCAKDVIKHLKSVVLSYRVDDKSNFIAAVKEIYGYLARLHNPDVINELREVKLSKWVWNGDGFSSPVEVILDDTGINLAPYVRVLPTETRNFSRLFTRCGMKCMCDADLLMEVLFRIKEKHELESNPNSFEIKRDLQLAIDILNELKPGDGEPFAQELRENLLVPIHVEDDSKLELQPVEECTYCDLEWLKQGHDVSEIDDTDDVKIKFIHRNIPNTTADLLRVPTLMSRILGAEELDMGESFGQSESLLDRLRGLLEGYTDGLSVPKELIQNADDAGATEVRFLYDERRNEDSMIRLIDEGMKECQGPALWAYNDAVFSDEDFQNIVKLNGATKKEDSRKIGRFGLGFNSVYNLTDVPSFVSKNSIVILDPHTTYLGKGIRDKRRPGIKLRMEEKKLRRLANQFKPYNGIFGCDLRAEGQPKTYNGTLFRFPLRTAIQAQKSGIKTLHYDDEQVKELLGILLKGAESLLLFTQNVLRVSVYHLNNESTESPQPIELFRISKSCHKVIHRLQNEISLSKPVQALASEEQEFVKQSSILKASWALMHGRMNEKLKSPTAVLMKSSMILNCQCTISDHGKQFLAFGSDTTLTHRISWLVTSCMVSGRALKMSLRNKGLLPTAGVAAKLTEVHSGKCVPVPIMMAAENELLYQNGTYHNGTVFCFLPLPIHNGLPIHINGCFAVDDSRRHLRERTEEDKKDQGTEWNQVLMKEVVCQAYIGLLEDIKSCIEKQHLSNEYIFHSLWPRYQLVKTNIHGIAAQFYQILCQTTLDKSLKMPKLFSDGRTWSDVQNVAFLEPAFRNNETIGQVALDVFKCIKMNSKTIVVDLPEEIFRSFEKYGLRNEVQKKCYNKERFFRKVFFPAIGSSAIDISLRDKLVLFALDDASEKLMNLVSSNRCVPSSPSGHELKFPKEFIHPKGKAAQLFDPEDGRFPYGEDFLVEERLVKLKKLGMQDDDLEWEEVIERAESIILLHPYKESLKRTKLMLAFIGRKLDNKDQVHQNVRSKLQQIKFLPLLRNPEAFPFKWKGDEYETGTFLSASELYPRELKYLVSVSVPILDDTTDGCGLLQWKVRKFLAMKENASFDQVKTQLKSVITTTEASHVHMYTTSFDELKNVFEKLYYYFQHSLKDNRDEVKDFLSPMKFILGQKQLLSASQVAFSFQVNYPPYLCPVSHDYELKFRELFQNVGVREFFEMDDYIKTLQEVKRKHGMNSIREDELNQVKTVINLLADVMKKEKANSTGAMKKRGKVFLPDSNRVMKPSSGVCVKDCYWMPDKEGISYVHEGIPPQVCITLGANTRRQQTLQSHSNGIPFGQKEKLTNRLKRILTGYPCDESIMKELLQNADDAKASKICFIKDPRQHPDERVFEECWKPLQGPALCVYNDAPFTKNDIKGIQNLGEGSKGDDPNKTGQYGVGFNAVYHLTDVPTFVSQGDEIGEVMCVFDPLLKFAPGAEPSSPGVMYDDLPGLRGVFTDVFPCYLGQHLPLKNATMFRFPLRNKHMASTSTICKKEMTIGKLNKLLDDFKEELLEVLLFVNSVKEISICEIDKKTGKLNESYRVQASLSSEDEKKRTGFAAYVNRIGKSLQSGERYVTKITATQVSYVVDLKDSGGLEQKWFVVQRIGFENNENIPVNIDEAFKKGDLGLLPRGGVALLINSSAHHDSLSGKAFCFLPLPFKTGLPVHINGHFALNHEDRRSLWRDDKGDYRSNWNDTLLRRVVAPCYVALLDEVRQYISLPRSADEKTYIIGSRYDGEHIISRYVECFPSFDVKEAYWNTLTGEVYRYIDARSFRLLPVLRQESKGGIQEQNEVMIEWLPPTRQGHEKAFFGDLLEKLPEHYEKLDAQMKVKAVKKTKSLRDTLLALGIHLLCMPMDIYHRFILANVDVSHISPKDVIDFFLTYNTSDPLCCIGNLPSPVKKTPFKSISNLHTVLKYCKQQEVYFFQSLDGLPLLLTQDEALRVFSQTHKVFLNGYCALLPHSCFMFVHQTFFNSNVFYCEAKCVPSPVFKTFDIAAFASLLPKEFDEDNYETTNRCVIWHPENKDSQIPNKQWIWHVWKFFSNYVEKIIKDYDDKQRGTLQYSHDMKMEEHHQQQLKTAKKRLTQEALGPVMDWCLLPAFKAVPDRATVSVKHVLSPLSMADTVIYLDGPSFNFLKETLRKLILPELNCRLPDGRREEPYSVTARRIVADVDDPKSVLSALFKKHKSDSNSFKTLRSYDCSTVLRYFNDQLSLLDLTSAEQLRKLPLYLTIHEDIISISGKQAFVLSPGIPENDMNIWEETSGIAFLKESVILENLYKFLGCDSKDKVDVYCDIIFKRFEDMSEGARLKHLMFVQKKVKSYSSDETIMGNEAKLAKILEALSKLRFIQAKDGSLKAASSFFDPFNKVFKEMFENKQEMFPSKPFCDYEWILFLRRIGLIHQVSNEQLVQFAKEVETEAKTRPDDGTRKKSEALIACLFESEHIATNNFKLLGDMKGIYFIFPRRVDSSLQDIHKQYGSREHCLPCICFQGSVASRNYLITWTSANYLPEHANPTYESDHRLNDPYVYQNEIAQQLDILQTPTVDMVVSHCKNICNVLCQMNATAHDVQGGNKTGPQDSSLIITIMTSIYEYLQENYVGNEDVIYELRTIRCIVVNHGKRFVYPNQVVIEFTSEQEIHPYLYRISSKVAGYGWLFEKLGTTNTVAPAQYAMVLENVYRQSGYQRLDPNETSKALKATKGLFETIVKEKQDTEISPLYLPGVKRNPDDDTMNLVFLRKSTDIFYNDAPHFKDRIKQFNNLVLVKLAECKLEVSNDDLLVKRLPKSVRPRMLTSLVHETLIEGNQPVSCSSTAQELRKILTSSEFCHGLIRLIRHEDHKRDVETSSRIQAIVQERLSCIRVFSVPNLQTRLVYNGATIPGSEADVSCFEEKEEEGGREIWKIYVEKGAELNKYVSIVAEVIDRITGHLLKTMLVHLPTMLSSTPGEIKDLLDGLKIREDNSFLETEATCLPTAGNFIHIADHHLLVDDFTVFYPGEYVGYELDDPGLRKEEGTPTYIHAIIIEEVIEEGLSSSATEPSSKRYRIDVGKNKEPIVVDAADLYKFYRLNQTDSESLELEVYSGPQNRERPNNLDETRREVRRILEDAWRLSEEKRMKIIKRLFLKWHPDKNPGNETFCTEIFKFIQAEIKRLEEKEGGRTGESFSTFYGSWQNRARYHSQQRTSFYSRGGYPSYRSSSSHRSNPQPGEASRWYRQARADLEAASNDVNYQRPSYEWACFKCHQSAEKALKAAQYSIDADKTNVHNLRTISQYLNNITLQRLASELEGLIGDSTRMRYPDRMQYPDIPHSVYTNTMASKAVELTGQIIQEVKSKFIN